MQKNIKQSLNSAFRKQKVARKDIDIFKKEFAALLGHISPKESEAHYKNIAMNFLNAVYYKDKHYINTKNNTDLVIHNGNNASSSVGVLIETKNPANKNEMINPGNLNKKALHELIYYYLQERKTGKNIELRYLIVTNIYEWFVFDAQNFESTFGKDNKLEKQFSQFENKTLAIKKTDDFYKDVVAPAINEFADKIEYTYFDIRDYEKYINSKDDNKMTDLYKILSPTHLLKLPFANDNNQLNKEFYAELLHIIGLEEIKKDRKKIIVRKEEDKRDDGSILENAFVQIEQCGKIENEQIYDVAFDLAITWVNRVLFLKLLESQILKYHNNDRNYAFLSYSKLNGYQDLNTLFFSVLAKKEDERNKNLTAKFTKVPYLNSSLFEHTETELKAISIESLRDDAQIAIYSKSVLRGENIQNLRPLEYLMRFLDAYDFSGDGSQSIQDERKTLISASVLGLIFEKINGYKDGSFFTPSFITMYMCRETIGRAVIQKFNEAKGWNCKDIKDLHNKIGTDMISEANKIFNSVKICDPAVGSGHFLVSALNEMIYLKSEIGILVDKNGKRLKDYHIKVENDELIINDNDGDNYFSYNPQNRESQRVQETLFHEKQRIIENCLFGVDINPNSVKICRLRLWIELLKNAYYHFGTNELETLPNIDINIKCGNSLISRFNLRGNYVNLPLVMQNQLREATKKYKKQVITYKFTDEKIARQETWKNIEEIKKEFMNINNFADPDYRKLEVVKAKLARLTIGFSEYKDEWKKEENELQKEIECLQEKYEKTVKSFFEWVFEFPEALDDDGNFIGFDVVIGNPPYGLFNKKQNQKIALSTEDGVLAIIKQRFPEAIGGMINAARIFYAFGFTICRKNAFLSMIVPYGILTDTTSAKLRKYIFDNYTLLKVDAFPERDNSQKRVFEDVKMSTAILLSKKEKSDKNFDLGISYEGSISSKRTCFYPKDLLNLNSDLAQIPLTDIRSFNLLLEIYKKSDCKFAEISPCLTGEIDITLGKDALTTIDSNPILVKGVQVDRFLLKTKQCEISQGIIEYVDLERAINVISNKKWSDTRLKRLVLQGLTGVNEKRRLKATIIKKNTYLANSCNYILENDKYKLEYVLAVFNSKLLNFVFKTLSTSSNVNGYEVDNLPFIKLSIEQQQPIIALVNQILSIKKKNPVADTSELENEIDIKIYDLYDLNDAERIIIDSQTK